MAGASEQSELIEDLQQRLRRFGQLALAAGLLQILLIVGSLWVIVYCAERSMGAFTDLPKYRVNTLRVAYRDAVREFDESSVSLARTLEDEQAQIIVNWGPQLAAALLSAEQEYQRTLDDYSQVMALTAEQVGGALEWNRHFQNQLENFRQRSRLRQAGMQAFIDRFPQLPTVDLPPAYDFKKNRLRR